MEKRIYKSYDDLPLYVDAMTVASLLGVSRSTAYELMRKKGFPSMRVGSRIIVPKDKLLRWLDMKTGGCK